MTGVSLDPTDLAESKWAPTVMRSNERPAPRPTPVSPMLIGPHCSHFLSDRR